MTLGLSNNRLTGPIPPELGDLANLTLLSLYDNDLTGPIPPELGGLGDLTWLLLNANDLTGRIPPELGDLANLTALRLYDNDLTGPIPPELGGMSSLRELDFTNNPGMSGPLPANLMELDQLDVLRADGTELCAPSDPDFQAWLRGVNWHRIKPCIEGDPPAYMVQAIQSREFPVPLVAGEEALLRVFVTAQKATSRGIPAVRTRFYVNGRETHVETIPGKSEPIPTEVDQTSLSRSANAEIRGHVVRPGLEMVIEVDPDGTLDPGLGVPKRIPETGRLAVDVRAMPLFDLTVIPFILTQTQDSSIVDLVEAMAVDPEDHEMLQDARTLLPIGDLEVTAHGPVLSSTASAFSLLRQTRVIRAMEGGTGHYMGMMKEGSGTQGVAYIRGRSSFSQPYPHVIAHELGHNLSLYHAPCDVSDLNTDFFFPYADGSIGTWGYDFRDGGSLVHPSTPDLMSYCEPQWISEYHFTKALRFRLSDEDSTGLPRMASAAKSLLLWGGVGTEGVPFLEPAVVVGAPPSLPRAPGEYRLAGRTATGTELFSFSFAMPETADGDGGSSFVFVLPVQPSWGSSLASITLTGLGGSITLDGDSDLSVAILRDPRTGQVRGILRDLPETVVTQADAVAAVSPRRGIEVHFSRGIPDDGAWRK